VWNGSAAALLAAASVVRRRHPADAGTAALILRIFCRLERTRFSAPK
jgi:hypothetical protein